MVCLNRKGDINVKAMIQIGFSKYNLQIVTLLFLTNFNKILLIKMDKLSFKD